MSQFQIDVRRVRNEDGTVTIIESDMFGDIWWFDDQGYLVLKGNIHDSELEDEAPGFLEPGDTLPPEEWPDHAKALVDFTLLEGNRVYAVQGRQWYWFVPTGDGTTQVYGGKDNEEHREFLSWPTLKDGPWTFGRRPVEPDGPLTAQEREWAEWTAASLKRTA